MSFWHNLEQAIEKTQQIENDPYKKQEKLISRDQITPEEWEVANKLNAIQEYVIDRFEEGIAVLEEQTTGKMEHVLQSKLPEQAKEGDCILCIHGKYAIDKNQTQARENKIGEKTNELWDE